MSNLNQNTTQLELLLAKVNALPEAGSGGTDTSDATATADEIFLDKTAYTADGKVTGTFTIDDELTEQNDLISQISILVQQKATPSGTDTSDATATEGDILSGKTAYVNGEKITGNIETKTASNLSASGATVTIPAGYYASQATKSVATATQATPSITVDSSGLITASATQTEGYVTGETKSSTKQLTTQAAKTITPSTSSQTAVAKDVYTTGAITVAAIPSSYVKPTTTKAATTYTPTTSNQTITAGTYCSGAQTIKGDANLIASNIASGVSIFGVEGSHSGVEDLDTELTQQENLISQLSDILDNKASGDSGGGANIETCTVTFESINSSYTSILLIQYTTLNSDGVVIGQTLRQTDITSPFSIQCVCNTCITGIFPPKDINSVSYTNNIESSLSVGSSAGLFFWGVLTGEPGDTAKFTFGVVS